MHALAENLLSPVVLCFALGVLARLLRSDLSIPESIYQGISIYLLLAIGLKGGAVLAVTPPSQLLLPGAVTLAIGILTPLSAWLFMRKIGRLGTVDAAAVAAHYGSVSVVTFLAAGDAVQRAGLPAEGFLPALVALLEIPGIIVALMLARAGKGGGWKRALHEVVTGKSIFLLIGGLVIGMISGPARLAEVQPFFTTAFKGALCLFMIELGLVTGARLPDVKTAGPRLVVLGCVIPVLHGTAGVGAGVLAGLSPGGCAVLGAMAGSASYIAAPSAVRVALPQANPAYYLTLALGITFPFNLALGIPLFVYLAEMAHG
ncbi:MAG: sodium-dependent bicarbonate transport family permease [Verrucomicrobiota bacterium]